MLCREVRQLCTIVAYYLMPNYYHLLVCLTDDYFSRHLPDLLVDPYLALWPCCGTSSDCAEIDHPANPKIPHVADAFGGFLLYTEARQSSSSLPMRFLCAFCSRIIRPKRDSRFASCGIGKRARSYL
jgi:hypothetical protein